MGGVSIVWTVGLLLTSSPANILGDSITGLGFAISSTTDSRASPAPSTSAGSCSRASTVPCWSGSCRSLGFGGMLYIFIKNYITVSTPGYNYSPPILGIQTPIVIGIGGLLLGLVFMIAQWIFMPEFFRRRPQTADPTILEAHLSKAPT